jgi:hypothetical protein
VSEQAIAALLGGITVQTISGRGWSPEELADRALGKIIQVGDTSHPAIRDQANAFKEHIRSVLVFYLREAQKSERTTICAKLQAQGQTDVANAIRSL